MYNCQNYAVQKKVFLRKRKNLHISLLHSKIAIPTFWTFFNIVKIGLSLLMFRKDYTQARYFHS